VYNSIVSASAGVCSLAHIPTNPRPRINQVQPPKNGKRPRQSAAPPPFSFSWRLNTASWVARSSKSSTSTRRSLLLPFSSCTRNCTSLPSSSILLRCFGSNASRSIPNVKNISCLRFSGVCSS